MPILLKYGHSKQKGELDAHYFRNQSSYHARRSHQRSTRQHHCRNQVPFTPPLLRNHFRLALLGDLVMNQKVSTVVPKKVLTKVLSNEKLDEIWAKHNVETRLFGKTYILPSSVRYVDRFNLMREIEHEVLIKISEGK
jgi:hypothetical protein